MSPATLVAVRTASTRLRRPATHCVYDFDLTPAHDRTDSEHVTSCGLVLSAGLAVMGAWHLADQGPDDVRPVVAPRHWRRCHRCVRHEDRLILEAVHAPAKTDPISLWRP